MRKQEKEVEATQEIQIEFDLGSDTLDKKKLRQLFLQEIDVFKNNKEGRFGKAKEN